MQRKLPQEIRDVLKGEIAYLGDIAQLYHEEPSLLDMLKHDLGFGGLTPRKYNKYHERISREDHENIRALITHLQSIDNGQTDCTDQELMNSYANGYTLQTGLPAWVKSTRLYQRILNPDQRILKKPTLTTHKNTVVEKFIIGCDITKRVTDLTEDTVSSLRSANLLVGLSKESLRDTIGALNLFNVMYEFGKGLEDTSQAYKGDSKHRPILLSEAGMRTAWSSIGIATCALYIAKIIFLPVALLGISIVMIPIFVAILAKDTCLYFEAKWNKEKSSKFDTASKFNNVLKGLKEKESLNSKDRYQLASMEHRQKTDPIICTAAEMEMRYSAIDLFAYLFIAAASCTAIAIYYCTAPVLLIVGKLALTATIIGVTTATAAKIYKARHEIANAANIIYELCKEKLADFLEPENTPDYKLTRTLIINEDAPINTSSDDDSFESTKISPPINIIPKKLPKRRSNLTNNPLPSLATSPFTKFSPHEKNVGHTASDVITNTNTNNL